MQEQRSSITKQVVDTLLFKNANMQVTMKNMRRSTEKNTNKPW